MTENNGVKVIEARQCIEKGNQSFKQGNCDEALRYFDRAIELDPTNTHAYSARGVTEFRLGLYESGWEDLNKAIQLAPEDCRVRYHMGLAMNLGSNNEAAVEDFNRALSISTAILELDADAAEKLEVGKFLPEESRSESVVRYVCPDITKIHPDIVPQIFYNRGIAYAHFGDSRAALADFYKATELEPKNQDAWINIGVLNSRFGRHQQALEDLDKALELDPNNALAQQNRERVLKRIEGGKI